MKRIVFNLTALTSVGLGAWCLGKFSEQRRYSKDNETNVLSAVRFRNLPCLPLFGTVSAATPLTPVGSNDMGSKVSSTATRVSQVSENRGSDQERLTNLSDLFNYICYIYVICYIVATNKENFVICN